MCQSCRTGSVRLARILLFVIPVTNGRLTKKNRPSRPVCCLLISPPILAGGLAAVNRLDLDADHAIVKEYRCTLALDKTQQRNRQADERIAVVHLLNLVGAAVTDLGSRTPTFTRSIVTEDLSTQSLKCFPLLWLRCEQFNGTVKGCRSNLATGLVMQSGDTIGTLSQHQESNLLAGDANLANGSGIGRGHCDLPFARTRRSKMRFPVAVNRLEHDHSNMRSLFCQRQRQRRIAICPLARTVPTRPLAQSVPTRPNRLGDAGTIVARTSFVIYRGR